MATKAIELEGQQLQQTSFKASQREDIFSRLADAAEDIESGIRQIESGLHPGANGSQAQSPAETSAQSDSFTIKKSTLMWLGIGTAFVFFASARNRRKR